jgi:bifunctional polynucleotide phosphatase/kinase
MGRIKLTACRIADNTNPDVDTRAAWISLAKKHGVPIRCIYFIAPAELCQHNDAVRAFGGESVLYFLFIFSPLREPPPLPVSSLLSGIQEKNLRFDLIFTQTDKLKWHNNPIIDQFNPEKRTILPRIAFSGFASRFVEPELSEGFQDMTRVEFQVRGSNSLPLFVL